MVDSSDLTAQEMAVITEVATALKQVSVANLDGRQVAG